MGRNSIIALGLVTLTAIAGIANASDTNDAIQLGDGDAPFALSVGSAKAKVGEATTLAVSVKANEGYKCNDQYPHKIKKLSGEGVKFGSDKVAGTVSGKSINFSIAVTPTSAGEHSVTGEARFSVCNDSQCVIKKVPFTAKVTGE